MTLVVNLYGGPGTGKSTLAAKLFSDLKWSGCECELITEYAKKLVWQEATKILDDQIYVFGKQQHMFQILNGQVDVIITDSPILLSIIYGRKFGTWMQRDSLNRLIVRTYEVYDNLDIFLKRSKPYVETGRQQTHEEAKAIDKEIWSLLDSNIREFDVVHATSAAPAELFEMVAMRLNQ